MAATTNPAILAKRLRTTHKQRVLKLYRDSLCHLRAWTVVRCAWREQAVLLREKFDENKHLTDKTQIEKVLSEGEKLFHEYQHPAPYIHRLSVNGTKWERNMPPGENFCKMLPIEEEWYQEMTEWANEEPYP